MTQNSAAGQIGEPHEIIGVAAEPAPVQLGRLEDLSAPVTARGGALAHRLVTAGGGPLYNSRDGEALRMSLNATLHALDLDA